MNTKSKSAQQMGVLSPKISYKAYLKGLQSEVEASRVAVENITRLSTGERRFKNKIDEIQQELQVCVSNISNQTKKQNILSQLISLLKGEMFKYQTTKKKQEEADRTQKQKLSNKIQYEIDQLLQKHNEEVAKIHQLKDVANSRRSERVVYSNLFKKLQKEIKHYEQQYKESIMKTETTRSTETLVLRPSSTPTSEQQKLIYSSVQNVNEKNFNELFAGDTRKSTKKVAYEVPECNVICAIGAGQMSSVFVTAQKQKDQSLLKGEKRKFVQLNQESICDSRLSVRNTIHREERIAHTKETLQQITHYTNLIDRIKIFVECSTTEEVLEHYRDLQKKNQELQANIFDIDEEVSGFQIKNQALKSELKQIQFFQQCCMKVNSNQSDISCENQEEEKAQVLTKSTQEKNLMMMGAQIHQIGKLFGICSSNGQQSMEMLNQGELKMIDIKMGQLFSHSQGFDSKKMKIRQQTSISEPSVEGLLDKMEKFSNCQRILDNNLFKQQYYKELSKRKVKLSRK